MIQLECSNCKTMLSIDDAFAGGVCRCQFCGTIQTVPKPSAKAAADTSSPKALFKRKARIESALSPYNDGLDKAADEMESSGALSPNALAGINTPPKRSASPAGDSSAGTHAPSGSQAGMASPKRAAAASPGSSRAGTQAVAVAPEPPRQAPAASPGKPHYVPKPSGAAAAVPQSSGKKPLIIAAAAVGVLVCGGGLWFALSGDSKPAPKERPTETSPASETRPVVTPKAEPAPVPVPVAVGNPAPVPVAAPETDVVVVVDAPTPANVGNAGSFGKISLAGTDIVYIVDRGGCTREAFERMLEATYGSVQTLGEGRKFALLVWNNTQDLAFPQGDLVAASAANLAECRKAIDDTFAGNTDIGPLVARAMTAKATDIVLVSAVDLDDLTAMAIRDGLAKAGGTVRFHGVAVGTDLTAERLKPLVVDHGGSFMQVDGTTMK